MQNRARYGLTNWIYSAAIDHNVSKLCSTGSLYPTQRSPQFIYPFLWKAQLVACRESTEQVNGESWPNAIPEFYHQSSTYNRAMIRWDGPWRKCALENQKKWATNEPLVLRSWLSFPLSSTFPNALPTYGSFPCQSSTIWPRTQKDLLKYGNPVRLWWENKERQQRVSQVEIGRHVDKEDRHWIWLQDK